MEKYDYIKYVQNKHEDNVIIPSSTSNQTNDTIKNKESLSQSTSAKDIKENQSINDNNNNNKELSFITHFKSQPIPSPNQIFSINNMASDHSLPSKIPSNFEEANTNFRKDSLPKSSQMPIKNTKPKSPTLINKEEEKESTNDNAHLSNQSSVYKPILPDFKSKLYNQGDLSLQEKILSLENSKKYDVNEHSQKFNNFYRNEKAKKFENYINKELSILKLKKDDNADMRRLEIYSHCMNMICEEFPVYGSLLADIKNEYDKVIQNIKVDQNEIHFLKMQIQKLLAQNENRLLLKYETQKNKDLENQLDDLLAENKSLNYYLNEKKDAFEKFLLNEKENDIGNGISKEDARNAEIIEEYEKKIENLENEIMDQTNEINELKEKQETMVPKKEKEELEHILKSSKDILDNLKKENEEYETSLREQTIKVKNLEKQLKDKENRYMFLIKEYKK
ncbi:hypothetical protein BCR36DRAFT_586972 [Piromyces finnis]|uniref:Translin-associated factor X-interacting protein 1 N-terminal domain-containing protein n=1 Tax=Piromyces finnis TaxID=1754191 RepID=A0A1Y1UX77_9FUNG|nr:hypothetical protein BCR36DRAFT_586972 [Piromyces finnis]|eukprot:ORX42825.1 hypothetical protein BCR36DRAFT_586972 [Piromyces finnis]